MDRLAAAEASCDDTSPIAFVNWPTPDPLSHPEEPNEQEDLVSVDANNVRPTAAWPGGTFANYHAYPYYPDFLRYEPGLQQARYAGPVGRDQGGHSEQDALAIDADTLRLIKVQGISGGFVFAWTDESSIHLRLDCAEEPTDVITIATSTQGGGATPPTGAGDADSDYAFELDPTGGTGQAWVRTDLDPTRYDGVGLAPTNRRDWTPQRLAINRSLRIDGRRFPVEYQEAGRLRQGVLDLEDPGYSGQAIWRQDGSTVRIRLPWAMTGLADPSRSRHSPWDRHRPRSRSTTLASPSDSASRPGRPTRCAGTRGKRCAIAST